VLVINNEPSHVSPLTEFLMNAHRPYSLGSVVSRDGTTIAYRRFGEGPGIIAVHGGAQAAQNFTKLAAALADAFTVYVPDRRGRGRSGQFGDHYGLQAEREDLDALLRATGSHNVFGLSSGAIIVLQAALELPVIRKLALYEPPLSINHSTPTEWVERYDREIADGKLGAAMVTAATGTKTAPLFLRVAPRLVVDPLLNAAIRAADKPRKPGSVASQDDVSLREIVPTMHYDAQLIKESEGSLATFRGVTADVLLLGGSRSARYLKKSLLGLERVLPRVQRVELPRVGHLAADDSGKPELVAVELRRFFS
jgi:pimeloyl-ACP methyl ester carboxylesterase